MTADSAGGEGSTCWLEPGEQASGDAGEVRGRRASGPAGERVPDDPPGIAEGIGVANTAPASDRPIEVLYIEDNPPNQRLVELALSRRGLANVCLASGGIDGLARIDEEQPDLVLLDLHLPDIDGDEVLRRLRTDARTADLPVVVLSADTTPARIQALRDEGAADYLTKPLELARLRDVVTRLARPAGDRAGGPPPAHR
jgi:CheY-like chemotaxis protein